MSHKTKILMSHKSDRVLGCGLLVKIAESLLNKSDNLETIMN